MPRTHRSIYSVKHLPSLAALFILVFNPPTRSQESPPSPSSVTPGRAASVTHQSHGLIGRVRRMRIERAKIAIESGKMVESARELLRETIYNQGGKIVDDAIYTAEASFLEGKVAYKYDDQGNVSETILLNSDGSVLSKEAYTYEFDAMGNWKKRITSAAVVEGGETKLAPIEVIYRTITYYYDQTAAQNFQLAPPIRAASGRPAAGIINSMSGAEYKPSADTPLVSKPSTYKEQSASPPNLTPSAENALSAVKGRTTGAPGPAGDRVANSPLTKVDDGKPSSQVSRPAETLHSLGLTYYKAGRYEKAVEALKQAVLRDPNHDEVHRTLSMVSADLSRLGREAVARKDAAAQYDIGNAYSRLGQFTHAVEAYNQAIRLNMKDPDLYNELGIAYGELGRYEEAVKAFRQAIRMRPDLAEAHNNIGLTYYGMGLHEEAVKSFRRAIDYQPGGTEAYYNLGLVYIAVGDRGAATEQYEILKTIAPELAERLLAEISKSVKAGGPSDQR